MDLIYTTKNHIADISINRPKYLNAMTEELIGDLILTLEQAQNDETILCVVLHAEGDRAFSAGGDIKAEVKMDGYSSYDFSLLGQKLMRTIRNLRVPVITAVHGYALGGGMEIMLASDFVFVADDAKIGIPSIVLGSMPGFTGTQLLPRVVGTMRAKEILMTGRHIKAEEAVALGLALEVVPKEHLMKRTYALAETLCEKAPFALRSIKTAVNQSLDLSFEQGLLLESQLFSRVQASEDKKIGMEAFINKSKPEGYHNR